MVRSRASLLILLAVALAVRAAGPGRPLSRWSSGAGQRPSGLAAPTLVATQPSDGSQQYMLELRGGAKKKDESKKNKKSKKGKAIDVESEAEDAETPVDVEDDEFNVAVDEDGFHDIGVNQGDFDGENTFARQMQSAIEKTPPVTQAFLTLSIGATLASFALNNNRFPDFLLLDWAQVVTRGQIWRLFTAFLYFGPLDISFALTVQFVWQYMSQLEKVHHKEPEQVRSSVGLARSRSSHVFRKRIFDVMCTKLRGGVTAGFWRGSSRKGHLFIPCVAYLLSFLFFIFIIVLLCFLVRNDVAMRRVLPSRGFCC